MKRCIFSIIGLLVFLLVDAQAANTDDDYKVGQIVADKYVVTQKTLLGDVTLYEIPLPKGSWTIVRVNENRSRTTNVRGFGVPMRGVSLAMINETKELQGYIHIESTLTTKATRWRDESCSKKPAIYKNNFGTTLWRQRCLSIALNSFLEGNNAIQRELKTYFEDNSIKYSTLMLNETYTQFSTDGSFIKVTSFIFPANFGMNVSGGKSLNSSPWNRRNYKRDPEKVNFVNALITWSEDYANIINASIEGKKAMPIEPFNPFQQQKIK